MQFYAFLAKIQFVIHISLTKVKDQPCKPDNANEQQDISLTILDICNHSDLLFCGADQATLSSFCQDNPALNNYATVAHVNLTTQSI